eukprot:1320694-Amphidinium_carterae.1
MVKKLVPDLTGEAHKDQTSPEGSPGEVARVRVVGVVDSGGEERLTSLVEDDQMAAGSFLRRGFRSLLCSSVVVDVVLKPFKVGAGQRTVSLEALSQAHRCSFLAVGLLRRVMSRGC